MSRTILGHPLVPKTILVFKAFSTLWMIRMYVQGITKYWTLVLNAPPSPSNLFVVGMTRHVSFAFFPGTALPLSAPIQKVFNTMYKQVGTPSHSKFLAELRVPLFPSETMTCHMPDLSGDGLSVVHSSSQKPPRLPQSPPSTLVQSGQPYVLRKVVQILFLWILSLASLKDLNWDTTPHPAATKLYSWSVCDFHL